jgi:hypothetical protein
MIVQGNLKSRPRIDGGPTFLHESVVIATGKQL